MKRFLLELCGVLTSIGGVIFVFTLDQHNHLVLFAGAFVFTMISAAFFLAALEQR